MDIDAFYVAHRPAWERLDELVAAHKLRGSEVDELVALYRGAARDLSRIRSDIPDPQLVAEMSTRVAAARGRINGTRQLGGSDVKTYFAVHIPAALYRLRWWTVGVMTAEILIALLCGIWVVTHPAAMADLGTARDLEHYARHDFEAYYTTYSANSFAAMVWTNNARIAALCVAGGITGILPVSLLVLNAVNVGQAGGIMAAHGMLRPFFEMISPHGMLELTCIFIAGAAGLKLFWTLLVPGPRPRSTALAQEGRALITVAVALTIALGVAGLIEAFVTPAPVAWIFKFIVGLLALAVLWAYTLSLGKRAVEAGFSGDLDSDDAGATQQVVG